MSDKKLTEAQQQAQAALDKVMNCRFDNFDAGAVIHWAERGMYQVKVEAAPDLDLLEALKAINADICMVSASSRKYAFSS